jgi:hypothetical protein
LVTGLMTRLMVLAFINMLMELYMKVNGKMICSMVEDLKNGQMDHHTLETITMVKSKELDYINGMMVLNTVVSG